MIILCNLLLCNIWSHNNSLLPLDYGCPNFHPVQREILLQDFRSTRSYPKREKMHRGTILLAGGHLRAAVVKPLQVLRQRSDFNCYDRRPVLYRTHFFIFFHSLLVQSRLQVTTAPVVHLQYLNFTFTSWSALMSCERAVLLQSTSRFNPNGKLFLKQWSIASAFYLHQKCIHYISCWT